MYTVDAFSSKIFSGNTCAVCIFPEWPNDHVLLNVAKQNLFAETAFIVIRDQSKPELRWFTTSEEVEFCGHGTLSAAYVYLEHFSIGEDYVTFETRHYGDVVVTKKRDIFWLQAPVVEMLDCVFDESVYNALGGIRPCEMVTSARGDLIIVYEHEQDVLSIAPDFKALMKNDYYGYIISSLGKKSDYVYRYFSPRMPDVWEDPVNGSSQSILAPYWAKQLKKDTLHGLSLASRGGNVYSQCDDDKVVMIGGEISPYMQGSILL